MESQARAHPQLLLSNTKVRAGLRGSAAHGTQLAIQGGPLLLCACHQHLHLHQLLHTCTASFGPHASRPAVLQQCFSEVFMLCVCATYSLPCRHGASHLCVLLRLTLAAYTHHTLMGSTPLVLPKRTSFFLCAGAAPHVQSSSALYSACQRLCKSHLWSLLATG